MYTVQCTCNIPEQDDVVHLDQHGLSQASPIPESYPTAHKTFYPPFFKITKRAKRNAKWPNSSHIQLSLHGEVYSIKLSQLLCYRITGEHSIVCSCVEIDWFNRSLCGLYSSARSPFISKQSGFLNLSPV